MENLFNALRRRYARQVRGHLALEAENEAQIVAVAAKQRLRIDQPGVVVDPVQMREIAGGHSREIMVVDVQAEIEIGQQHAIHPGGHDDGRGFSDARAGQIVLVFGERAPAYDQLENRQERQQPVKQEQMPGTGECQRRRDDSQKHGPP